MDWTAPIDNYCERLGPGLWAEPINALTNAAFLIAALVMWRRARGMPLARALCILLFLIGIGSGLFHTLAHGWSAMADVLPILAFVLLYIYAANRHFLGLGPWAALAGVAAFFPFAAAVGWAAAQLPFFSISAPYWPVCLMIALYGAALIRRPVGRGLLIGAAILALSLTFRSLDMGLCHHLPHGTHFMWHILNGIMLGWMIEVLRRNPAPSVA